MKNIAKGFLIAEGALLVYSGFSLLLASDAQIRQMMSLAKVRPLIPLPFWTMEFAFLFNGVMLLLIGLNPAFGLYLNKKEVFPIVLRVLSVFSSIVMINPMILEIQAILRGEVNFLAIATAPGLLFPGGLFVHVFFQHWLGGILGFSVGIYPKLFAALHRVKMKVLAK